MRKWVTGKPKIRSISERFWEKVSKGESCWEWLGSINVNGYGIFSIGYGQEYAHRVSIHLTRGVIPKHLQVDHICRNRKCVNPSHLELVTSGENTRRGISSLIRRLKTHCKNGHEYTPSNTLKNKKPGNRRCRECHRLEYWKKKII